MDNFYAVYVGASHGTGSGVSSLNGLTGALTLVAGSGISITPAGSNITIAATGFVSNTLAQNHIFVGNASNVATDVPMTGDVNIAFSAGNGVTSLVATSNSTLTTLSALSLPVSQLTGILPIANGGTNSSTALNNHRVMISSSGAIVENAALTQNQLMFPDANGLPSGSSGFSVSSSPSLLSVFSNDASGAAHGFLSENGAAGIYGGFYLGKQSRGSNASPTATQSGDHLVDLLGRGYGTTAYSSNSTGRISFLAAENFTDTAMGTNISMSTTPIGSVTAVSTLSLTSDQGLRLFNADSSNITIRTPAGTASYNLALPAAQSSGTKFLQNDGSGNLSWASAGGSSLSSLTSATGTNTIDNVNYAQSWTWNTLSTQAALSLSSSSMTSGSVLSLTNSFNDATSTGNILTVTSSGQNNASIGIGVSSASNDSASRGIKINMTSANSNPGTGLEIATVGGPGLFVNVSGSGNNKTAATFENAGNSGSSCVFAYSYSATGPNSAVVGRTDSTDSGATAGKFSLGSGSATGISLLTTGNGSGLAFQSVGASQLNGTTVIGAASTTPTHSLNSSTGSPVSSASPTGYVSITINGTLRYIPYYT